MDSSAIEIQFDEHGICSYCRTLERRLEAPKAFSKSSHNSNLEVFINEVKLRGTSRKYDCIIGVSGGLDSSWALVKAVQLGLRPLAVHMDNGWNSEIAQNNISNLITSLNVDLFTYVIEWSEYRNLMQSFFDADVIDVELLYDNAMLSVCYAAARKYKIKYILSGSNNATEGMVIPPSWNWYKLDARSIRAVAKKFGKVRIQSFPIYGTFKHLIDKFVLKIKWVAFLDFFEYNKEEVLNILESEFGFKKYPYKHYESIFTRFYQGYILPNKFNVDKRKVHLSTLIMTNQLSRDSAIKDLESIPYPTSSELDRDIQYFLKKMKWSTKDLNGYIDRPARSHAEFGSELKLVMSLKRFRRKMLNLNDEVAYATGENSDL